MVYISEQRFKGKQHIPWNEVEIYVKQYVGKNIIVSEYGDKIKIPSGFPGEFSYSKYSQNLKGGLAKVKANASQVIVELVQNATNRRYVENKDSKHNNDAIGGWYRYDSYFMVAVRGEDETQIRWNQYTATIVVRINDTGNYLHDIINIKKEARTPIES